MSNLVIVAIPDENDRVWKVSSEKIPHLTLLFLGDVDEVSNADQITQFVEHAANTTLKRFYLPVDRRGELGEDKADVLFFKKGRYDYKAIWDFRVQLLKDNNIRTAYDSTTQFEGPWQPHLTLGYPDTPAKPDDTDRDYGFYDVAFNKVAVWFGDFEGPDFLLKDYWDEFDALDTVPMDVAMSGILHHGEDEYTQNLAMGAAFLAHSGVKGMKWGVRNSRVDVPSRVKGTHIVVNNKRGNATLSTASVVAVLAVGPAAFLLPKVRAEFGAARAHNKGLQADKKQAKQDKKADAKWEKGIYTEKTTVDVHNAMADHFNPRIGAINSKPAYKNMNLWDRPNDADAKAYSKEVDKLTHESYSNAVKSVVGTSPSGKKRAELGDDGVIKLVDTDKVKHAADDLQEIGFILKRDSEGKIVEMNQAELTNSLAQTMDLGADFLEHFGVKGMRWGVRKPPPEAVSTSAVSRVPHGNRRKTKIDVEGGQNHPAHEDAIKVAEARAKLKKSGTAALSNSELQTMAKRLQLETQVAQLTSSRGSKFIQRQLEQQGQQQVQLGVRTFGPKVVKKGAKKAGKVAATGAVGLALL